MLILAESGPEFLLELIRKPWMSDELTGADAQVFFDLQAIYDRHPEGAMQILRLPVMDTVGPEEETLVDGLAELLRTNKDREGFERALSELASTYSGQSDS